MLACEGAFREQISRLSSSGDTIEASINHDPRLKLGSTATGLLIGEDLHGLFYALRLPPRRRFAAFRRSHDPQQLFHDAFTRGHITGLSLGPANDHPLGALQSDQTDIPYLRALIRYPIREFSFGVFPLFPATSGTWVREGGPQAMADLYHLLKLAPLEA
jgi:phage head maturation protease